MRILLFLISLALIAGCASENDKKNDSSTENTVASQPVKLEPIEATVPDPEPEQKKPTPLTKADISEAGIKFNLNLPEGYNFTNLPDEEGVRIIANSDRFVLDIYRTDFTYETLRSYWQEGTENYNFRKWVINSEDGVMVEVEKDGKAEFHVDYIFDWEGKRYRLVSAKDKAFSQWEASQMFNVCRTVKALNPSR